MSKSRDNGIEWPKFVESPKKRAENSLFNIVIRTFNRAQCEASKGQAQSPKKEGCIPLYSLPKRTPPL